MATARYANIEDKHTRNNGIPGSQFCKNTSEACYAIFSATVAQHLTVCFWALSTTPLKLLSTNSMWGLKVLNSSDKLVGPIPN